MLTFQNLHELFEKLSKDNSTANITLGKLLINNTQKSICSSANFTFLDDEWFTSSVANSGIYRLPHNLLPGSVSNVYVKNGNTKYFPNEIHSITEFDELTAFQITANSPDYYCIYNDCIYFYPSATDTSWEIHLKYCKMAREMTADDYTTGTITATNNSPTITGDGTTFTSTMEGRWIKLPDGLWYEISLFEDTTTITLVKTYEGPTTAGATYIIGEIPVIPDGFQELLVYKPLEHYFMMAGEERRSSFYKNLYDLGIRDLKSRYLSRSANQVFVKGKDKTKNPNDYPTGLKSV